MMFDTVKREGSEEIRQAEGIKIELKTGFVLTPPHVPGLLLITKLSGPRQMCLKSTGCR